MARFRFKLEAVLRHRLQQEQQRQRDLAIAQGQVAVLEGDLAALSRTTQASLDDLRQNHLVGRIDVSFLTAHRRYMRAVERKVHTIAAEIAQAATRVTAAQAALAQAAMQRKMLEKLREKQKEVWMQDQARKEFAEADDVGMRLAFAIHTAEYAADSAEDATVDHGVERGDPEPPDQFAAADAPDPMQREDHA